MVNQQRVQTNISQGNMSDIAQQAAAAAAKRLEANQNKAQKGVKREVDNAYLQAVYQRLSLSIYGIPASGTLVALVLLPYTGLHGIDVALLIVFHILSFLGLEVGYHRLFSHRAFQATVPLQVVLAILGATAVQGGVVHWVAQHRLHHRYSDKAEDPHSPHLHGQSTRGRLQGLWFAQIGWVLQGKVPNVAFWAKDMLRSRAIARVNQLQQVWVVIAILLPALLDGLITQSWMGALRVWADSTKSII